MLHERAHKHGDCACVITSRRELENVIPIGKTSQLGVKLQRRMIDSSTQVDFVLTSRDAIFRDLISSIPTYLKIFQFFPV